MTDTSTSYEILADKNQARLFTQAPAPIAIYKGRELRYVFVNDAYSAIFNYRSILGKTVREAFPELEGQPFYAILENVFDTGVPFYGNETPALVDAANTGTPTTRYYNLVYTSYKNEQGDIEGVMAFGHDVTDQVEARKKERESDLRFRNIVEQSSDPILILKGDNLVLDIANEALFKLWNVGQESLGKPFLEILPEMSNQGFYELLLDVYRTGAVHSGNETPAYLGRANGELKKHYFNFIYQPYRESNGMITGVLVLAKDVTEQVLAKNKLVQSERNFQNMIFQAPVAMCVMKGKDHVLEIANDLMFDLWRKKDKIFGLPIFDLVPELRGQGLEVLLDNVYNTGERYIANERPVTFSKEGTVVTSYINFVYEPFYNSEAVPSGVIAVAFDVTEQVLSRQKIEYAEENARLAIESAELGTYEVNLITNEIITSPRFKAIWGVEEEITDRSTLAGIIHPGDKLIRERAHKEALAGGNLHYEARINRDDKTICWVKVKGKVLYDKDNTPVRLLGVIQDITEQKVFAEELSQKVDERTKALQEVNARLKRSNEELEEFAFVASHDLQEPLRKIQLFSSLILEQPGLNDQVTSYLGKVSASANRMRGLIRDVLEYSRLSHKSLPFANTDLNTILEGVLTDLELLISKKHAVIHTTLLPTLEAVPLQMNQLLLNLINNALKFSRQNVRPEISVSANKLSGETVKSFTQLDPGMEYFEIKVKDNGIGFNQAYANKIFTIFQKLNEKRTHGDYGIGLALCRKIVDNHSGIIYAEGKPGEGASFNVILPSRQIQHT